MYSKKVKRFKRVYIEITNICNMSCSFCPKTNRKKEYMKLEDFEKVLIKVKDYTDYIYLHVKGEPLMHPELYKIIDLCKKYNMQVNITTNGTLLNENKKYLSSNSVRQLNISLHSFENIDDEIEMNKLYECIESAKYISENSDTIIAFRLWNIEDKYENVSLQNKFIVDKIEEIFEIFDLYDKLKINNNIKIKDKVFLNIECKFIWPDMNEEEKNMAGKCLGLIGQIGILVDGTVVPCCLDNNGDINLGNILSNDTTFDEILNSNRAQKIISDFKLNRFSEELCRKCGYVKREKLV
jgi:radical SAM protein with 4Fe4S-binding SPASM domain